MPLAQPGQAKIVGNARASEAPNARLAPPRRRFVPNPNSLLAARRARAQARPAVAQVGTDSDPLIRSAGRTGLRPHSLNHPSSAGLARGAGVVGAAFAAFAGTTGSWFRSFAARVPAVANNRHPGTHIDGSRSSAGAQVQTPAARRAARSAPRSAGVRTFSHRQRRLGIEVTRCRRRRHGDPQEPAGTREHHQQASNFLASSSRPATLACACSCQRSQCRLDVGWRSVQGGRHCLELAS